MAGDIVIVSAARTAVGSFNGAFADQPAHKLGAAAVKAAIARAGIEAGEVDEVILGQVLTAAQGQNPARQAAMAAGIRMLRPPGASTRSAARACGPSRLPCSRSAMAMRISWSRAVRNPCRCRPMPRICAPARNSAT